MFSTLCGSELRQIFDPNFEIKQSVFFKVPTKKDMYFWGFTCCGCPFGGSSFLAQSNRAWDAQLKRPQPCPKDIHCPIKLGTSPTISPLDAGSQTAYLHLAMISLAQLNHWKSDARLDLISSTLDRLHGLLGIGLAWPSCR